MRTVTVTGVLILGAGVLLASNAAGADDPLSCKCKTYTWAEGQEHNFNSNGELEYRCGYSVGNEDYECHVDMLPGSCSTHIGCGEDPPDNLTSAMEIAGRRSASYNAERGALQLFDCDGQVAANIPVLPGELAAVLEILELRYIV